MSTLTAIRCNPVIKKFYNRLIEAGKATKVAITACMRKLLTILNAMVKNENFMAGKYSCFCLTNNTIAKTCINHFQKGIYTFNSK